MVAVSFQIVLGPVELVAEVDSTNRVVMERARAGAPEGLVVVADHQTAGRGRLGRVWEAPPGSSLLVSVLLRPRLPASGTHVLSMAAAVAAAEACDQVGVHAVLKWPNDLLLGEPERKLAGILAEADVRGDVADVVVVGMGLNLNWPAELPPDLVEIATSLNHHADGPVDRGAILHAWLAAFDALLADLDGVRQRYLARCTTVGRLVRVERHGGFDEGRAVDVDDGGGLVVEGPSGSWRVDAGDVVHLRGR